EKKKYQEAKKITNAEKKKNKILKEQNVELKKEKEKWKTMFNNLKIENDKDKEKIKELQKILATKEIEIKDKKERYETLYNACITNHSDYDQIKKELEKITKELFISVHTGQIGDLLGIALLEGIGNTTFGNLTGQQWVDHYKIPVVDAILLTPLLSKIGLNFYLVRICDKDLAKKTQND
ncbi:26577_t:CDS:2, partial [Racocetra persica]